MADVSSTDLNQTAPNQSQSNQSAEPPKQLYSEFPKNAYMAMMVEPKVTLTKILGSENPRRGFWLLLTLVTLSSALSGISNGELGDRSGPELYGALFGMLLVVPIAYMFYYLGAWVVRAVGTKLGGDGELRDIVTGMVWGQTPLVFSLLLILVMVGMYGTELFTNPDALLEGGWIKLAAVMFIAFLQMVFGVWALVLGIVALSITLNLNIGKTIATYLLSILLFLVPFIVIGVIAALVA